MKVFSSAILILSAVAACSAGLLPNDFYTSDENGGYHFGFNDGRLARHEQRSPDGIVRGAYSYVDANGQTQTVTYTADSHNGFVASGSSIPQNPAIELVTSPVALPAVVEDTPEVKVARAEHLEAHRRALGVAVQEVAAPAVSVSMPYNDQLTAGRVLLPSSYAANQGLTYPVVYSSQPSVRYHPDYLPYAHLQ